MASSNIFYIQANKSPTQVLKEYAQLAKLAVPIETKKRQYPNGEILELATLHREKLFVADSLSHHMKHDFGLGFIPTVDLCFTLNKSIFFEDEKLWRSLNFEIFSTMLRLLHNNLWKVGYFMNDQHIEVIKTDEVYQLEQYGLATNSEYLELYKKLNISYQITDLRSRFK